MLFEIGVFWVKVGGVDPVSMIRKLGKRISQLHLKDLKKGTPARTTESSNSLHSMRLGTA